LRAVEALKAADIVVHDGLIDPRVLDYAPAQAQRISVAKQRARHTLPQEAINALIVAHVRAGSIVVRLKGGDPFVFGRGGEEVDALREAGIEVEVINGLSAGLAAPASVGVPVTDRRCTPGVAFVTGHNGEHGIAPDWEALARSRLTLVVYMGLTRAAVIAQALRDGGLAAETPAVIVSAAHTPRQRECFTTVADLPAAIEREGLPSPALLVIGEVVALSPQWRADVGLDGSKEPGVLKNERLEAAAAAGLAVDIDDSRVAARFQAA
jgi:uroporphyrin-III C-methyltransferase